MMLTVDNVCFSYGRHKVLDGVSFDARRGEVVCIMGPNGSGKSTLLDSIIGLNKIKDGSILVDNTSVNQYTRQQLAKKIAYIPQNHDIAFPYTVREVVLMGRTAYAYNRGITQEDEDACTDAMRLVGIELLADKQYDRISGGELRMVLLSRALCQQTPIILMDEPTSHLDYKNEIKFLEIVSNLCNSQGITVIIATHNPEHSFYFENREVNTKAVFIKDGVVAACGAPKDVVCEETLRAVYGVNAKILESDGQKTILLKNSYGDSI